MCIIYYKILPLVKNSCFWRCQKLYNSSLKISLGKLRQDPPCFWSILTFLHYGKEKVERHLLWKFHKKIWRKSWSNVPPKLLACIKFLYKVVHKIGCLWKFNRARESEFKFFTAWTIFMKLGTLAHHVHGYKMLPQIFQFLPRDLVMVFQSRKKKRGKIITKLERS